MATTKEKFNVNGKEIVKNEKLVFDYLERNNQPLSYKEIQIEGLSDKSKIGILARLDTQHHLIKKIEGKKGTTYKVNKEILESLDLSKLSDKENIIINGCKDFQEEFSYKDLAIDNMNDKAKIATLARLDKAYGILEKIDNSGVTKYQIEND